jgi:hypothetical protein
MKESIFLSDAMAKTIEAQYHVVFINLSFVAKVGHNLQHNKNLPGPISTTSHSSIVHKYLLKNEIIKKCSRFNHMFLFMHNKVVFEDI